MRLRHDGFIQTNHMACRTRLNMHYVPTLRPAEVKLLNENVAHKHRCNITKHNNELQSISC